MTFVQFSHFVDQLQQGPVLVSSVDLDDQEALKGKRIPSFALHLSSKLLVCGTLTFLTPRPRFGDLPGLAAEPPNSWVTIYCALPVLRRVSAWALWQEHEPPRGKRRIEDGERMSVITTFCSSPCWLTGQLPGGLNEKWSRCWSSGISGHLGFSLPPLQNMLCNYPASYNPEVGWTEHFLQLPCNRDTVWYFQGKKKKKKKL